MPKCWIHSETAQPTKTKPLKTHPGFPEDSIKQGLALALVSKPQVRDLEIKPYRYWEFEKFGNEIKGLKNSLENLKEEAKKKEEKFLEEIEQSKLDYQFLNEEKNKEIAELNHKLNQLITRILNISEKPVGTFDPELKKQKGIKELLERYSVGSLEELVIFINNAVEKSKVKPETNQELQDFLDNYSAANLAQVVQTWENTEKDYLKRIEELKVSWEEFESFFERVVKDLLIKDLPFTFENLKWLNKEIKSGKASYIATVELLQKELKKSKSKSTLSEEDKEKLAEYEDLITERDETIRDKKTLEQQNLALNNQLKNKQQEANNKDQALDQLKKEKSQSEISLNAKLTTEKQQHKGSLERIKLLTEQITTLNQEIGELKAKLEEK